MKQHSAIALAVLGFVVASAAPARADDQADTLFKKGKKLLESKRYSEACASFEESNKLDPGIGILLNIAHCYEDWGKLATAYHKYRDAESMAKRDKDNRIDRIRERIKALEDQVPRLVVKVPAGASTKGLVVKVDGVTLPPDQLGEPQMTDPGPHTVDYKVGDTAKREMIVAVEPGETRETKLPLRTVEQSEEIQPTGHTQTVEVVGHTQRVVGVVVDAVGLAAVGTSLVLTLQARSKYNSALSKDCGGQTDACDPVGLTDTHNARSEANTATIVFGVGMAAIAGGVITYLISPTGFRAERHDDADEAYYVTPTMTPDGSGFGFAFGGRL